MADAPSYDALLELLRARRSIRRLRPQSVPEPLLERLLEAARWAPSASGRQAFRLVVVTDAALIVRMHEVVGAVCQRLKDQAADGRAAEIAAYSERYFLHFGAAPAVIVPIYRLGPDLLGQAPGDGGGAPRHTVDVLSSVSAAVMQLLLAAQTLGLGACWMTGPLVAAAELATLLNVPPGWEVAALIPVGFPDEAPEAPRRRELAQLVRWVR
jgi:nitroreductase